MPDAGGTLWELAGAGLRGDRAWRLEDVSLRIVPGATAVLGHSGAGKTSLLNLLVGFEKPDTGRVVGHVTADGGALPVYWAPQTHGLWPHMTARQHLEAVSPPQGAAPPEEWLARFGLTARADACPDAMSHGERARLAVCRALAARPRVLVMDEPLASVDPGRSGAYWRAIREFVTRTGASLVFATHSPETVLGEADRVICLDRGRVRYTGDVATLYHAPATPALALCLGEANWMAPEDARLWLNVEQAAPRCYRPEAIAVAPRDDGPLIVRGACFRGSVAETELEHEKSGARRIFFHRPSSNALRAGGRVAVTVLTLLLAFLAGCERAEEPRLRFREIVHWRPAPLGRRVPAPRALTFAPDGRVIAVDNAARVLVFAPDGTLERQWRMPATTAGNPEGVCVLKDGRIAVADTHYSRVVFFDRGGRVQGTLGRYGKGEGEFIFPVAVTQDEEENLYVCEYGSNDRIQKFTVRGEYRLSFGGFGTGPGMFQRPSGMVAHAGRLYVADAINNRVLVFSYDGKHAGAVGADLGLYFPYGIAMGPGPSLYLIEYGGARITRMTPAGRLLGRFGSQGTQKGCFRTPWELAVAPDGRVLVADTGNRRIVELRP